MANYLFNAALTSIVKGEILFLTDTVKYALYLTAPDIDADTYLADITGESSGTGYTTGGNTLAGKTVTTDNTNNRTIADATDGQFTGLTTTFRYVVVYQSTGNVATSRLISAIDYGSVQTVTNGTLDITWPVSGVFNIANV